jgi:hypothetical protein
MSKEIKWIFCYWDEPNEILKLNNKKNETNSNTSREKTPYKKKIS